MKKSENDKFEKAETEKRFLAILRGAMHKPTPHKDVPQKKNSATANRKKPTGSSKRSG